MNLSMCYDTRNDGLCNVAPGVCVDDSQEPIKPIGLSLTEIYEKEEKALSIINEIVACLRGPVTPPDLRNSECMNELAKNCSVKMSYIVDGLMAIRETLF